MDEQDESISIRQSKKSCVKLPARYVVGILGALAIVVNFWIKVSLSVAVIAMVKSNSKNSSTTISGYDSDTCPIPSQSQEDDDTTTEGGEFDWDENMQGVILSAYFYGFVSTQLFGGIMSQKFGGKYVIGSGVSLAGLFIILSPLAARLSAEAFIVARVLQGLSSGVITSGMNPMFSDWFVPEERQVMFSFIFSSTSIGSVVGMVFSGMLASYSWDLAFYIPGAAAFIWLLLWLLFVYNNPLEHPRISEEERNYIISRTGKYYTKGKDVSLTLHTPFLKIFTSPPLLTHFYLSISSVYVLYMFLTELPTYTANILHYDIQSSGFISSLPELSHWVSSLCSSFLSQAIQNKGYLSKMNTYRIFNAFSFFGPAMCLLAITLSECNSEIIIFLLVLTMLCNGMFYGGSISNHMDLANNYVGLTTGVNFTLSNCTAIIIPLVTGALTNNNQTLSQWKIVFYIAIVVSVIPYFLFLVFGSVNEQEWNKVNEKRSNEEEKVKV